MSNLKMAVIGTGHMGRYHVNILANLPGVDLVAIADRNEQTLLNISNKYEIKGYLDYTLDGYVVVMQPRRSSLTKGEFMDILDTFERVD